MRIFKLPHLLSFLFILILSSYSKAQTNNRESELKQLYQQDQAMQILLQSKIKSSHLQISNAERRTRVMELLVEDLAWSKINFKKAAIIFQHTNTGGEPDDKEDFRSQEGHILCFYLARQNLRMGGNGFESTCLWRYLIASKLPQNLGLEVYETTLGNFSCLKDPFISDEQRLSMGFPFRLSKAIGASCPAWVPIFLDIKKALNP